MIVLNIQKNPYLNQAAQKKYLPIFSYLKKTEIENFKSKKILRLSLSLKLRVPHPKGMLFLQKSPKNYCGKCSLMKFVSDLLCHSSGAFSV